MISRPDYRPSAYDDDWEDAPAGGPNAQWIGGVLVPLLLIGYGLTCFVTGSGTLLSGRSFYTVMHLHGPKAVALGIASTALGLFLHCHYFWGNSERLAFWAPLGKIISLIGVIGGLGYVIVRFFVG